MQASSTYQRELFAIVEAVYKWRQYLIGQKFIIWTDHKSIKELMQQVIETLIQQQYVRKLLGFDFTIEYKVGLANKAVDALSRVYEEEVEESAFLALSRPVPHLLQSVRHECETNEELQKIMQQAQVGSANSNYVIREGILLYKIGIALPQILN